MTGLKRGVGQRDKKAALQRDAISSRSMTCSRHKKYRRHQKDVAACFVTLQDNFRWPTTRPEPHLYASHSPCCAGIVDRFALLSEGG
jgi:hypothetical protein